MGNVLRQVSSHLFHAQPPPTWTPNSTQGDSTERSTPAQIQDLVLHLGVPIFCIVALNAASREFNQKKDRRSSKFEEDRYFSYSPSPTSIHRLKLHLEHLEQEKRNKAAEAIREESHRKSATNFPEMMEKIEKEENVLYQNRLKKVSIYDEDLKDILDIKCSLFRSRVEREKIEERMMDRLVSMDTDLNKVMRPSEFRDIIKHDQRFCGSCREDNGKLRQLYLQTWKLRYEVDKYKSIIEKMKAGMLSDTEINSLMDKIPNKTAKGRDQREL